MNQSISVRPEAQADIRHAVLWYESQQAGLGNRLRDEARMLLRRIADNPLMFPTVYAGVRRALLNGFPYSVYFMIDGDTVVIIAILHQHRRPDTWMVRR